MAYRSILCPVDLSATSRAALRAARELADSFDATLSVLFVDDPLLSRAALRFDEDELARKTRAELTRFVQRVIGERRQVRLRDRDRQAGGGDPQGGAPAGRRSDRDGHPGQPRAEALVLRIDRRRRPAAIDAPGPRRPADARSIVVASVPA